MKKDLRVEDYIPIVGHGVDGIEIKLSLILTLEEFAFFSKKIKMSKIRVEL